MKSKILNFNIYCLSKNDLLDDIFNYLTSNSNLPDCPRWLACLNPHSYSVSLQDESFSLALKSADWLIPDGVGVVIASRILSKPIKRRITGSDIFYGLNHRLSDSKQFSVFFLGSTEFTLEKIQNNMSCEFPNIRIAGFYSPPFESSFSQKEKLKIINKINSSKADVLWVGLTAPKQEKWIYENLDLLDIKFAAAIGAVFDFYAGNIKRSHRIFHLFGLEWLPRLLREPRRLWKRSFISAPIFILHVFKSFFEQLK